MIITYKPTNSIKPMIEKLLKGDFLDGKKTYISLLVAAAGLVAGRFGIDLPKQEVNGIIEIVRLNWEDITVLAGLVAAAWARLVTKGPQKK